jgi:hypothetical protein
MRLKIILSVGIILICSSVLVLAALDLRFTTAISQSPDPANEGDTVVFTVTFKTFGGAVDNLKITGGVDGTNIFERTYSHINADLPRTDSFSWIATAGSHTVWFELDPAHTCGDSNYNNNRVEKAITVNFGAIVPPDINIHAKPNLTVTDCHVEPSTYKNGDEVTLKFTIKNIGDAPTTSLSLVEYKNYNMTQSLGERTWGMPPVEPGYTYTYVFNYWVIIPSVIKITVDTTNLNAESIENDNTCSIIFKAKINKPKKYTNPYKP